MIPEAKRSHSRILRALSRNCICILEDHAGYGTESKLEEPAWRRESSWGYVLDIYGEKWLRAQDGGYEGY